MSNSNQHRGRIIAEHRRGPLSATLWANDTEQGERLSVTIRRAFQRQNGEWDRTKMSIPRRLVLDARELLRLMDAAAWEHINSNRASSNTTPAENIDQPF